MIQEFSKILGVLMNISYKICNSYGIAIIIFTVLSKIILFPINVLIQKNSIKMLKIKPDIEKLKYTYSTDKEKFMDKQIELFEKENYKPSLGIIPLLLQIPIILGLIKVIEAPQNYIGDISNVEFLNINLCNIPVFYTNMIIPVIAAISSVVLCVFQNRVNVLQRAESMKSKIITTTITTVLTVYFVFLVPNGVGLYWILGNIISIIQMYILNAIYPPDRYINYEELKYWQEKNKQKKKENAVYKKKEKNHYKKFFEPDNIEQMKLIFYSEQSGFYKYYSGIIEYILKNSDIVIHYITSDPNDKIFNLNNDRLKTYYIGKNRLISLFMKIEANMVVMTTPDLQKYYLKRSLVRKDIEYVYIDHGMPSVNLTLRSGALDYYDTIFATGPEQLEEIRQIEKLRNTKKKNIVEIGFPLIDDLISKYNMYNNINNNTILIAPSHQEDNILESCIDEILEQLLDTEYKIIIRPHPQFIIRNREKVDNLINKYKDKINENFKIELDFSSNETIYMANLVITDWSGIGMEYSLSTTKPTLYINTKMKIINQEYSKIPIEPIDLKLRNQIGKAINKSDIINIKNIIDELIQNQEKYKKKNIDVRKKHLYNIGESAKIAGEYIINKIKNEKILKEE